MDKSIGGRIFPAASGFRPIDSIALKPISAIASAGIRPPSVITSPDEIEISI